MLQMRWLQRVCTGSMGKQVWKHADISSAALAALPPRAACKFEFPISTSPYQPKFVFPICCCAEEELSPMPKQQAILKQQGVSPQLVSQQVLMQHAGQEPEPEVAASSGRSDAAQDDAVLVSCIYVCQHCLCTSSGMVVFVA